MGSDEKSTLRTILDRLKEAEGVSHDVDLAAPLRTNKRNISAWKERGAIPWERLSAYCREREISLEWLINGRGPQSVLDIAAEPGAIYRVPTDQDAICLLSGDIYRALQETGREITPEKFADIVRLLHRDMLDRRLDRLPYEKVQHVVKLAV